MGYKGQAKVLFYHKAFLLVLNTTHLRKTAILYLTCNMPLVKMGET